MDQTTRAKTLASSLYVSHFLSTWNARGFEFGAVLFLATIFPGTLLPISLYAFFRALAAIIFSPSLGNWIDTTHRLRTVRTSIIGQRLAVVLSCGLFLLASHSKDNIRSPVFFLVFGCLVVLACLEKLFSIMNTVAVERDWVVVIANEDEELLRDLNAQMRRIDLGCKLVSPLGIAFLHSWSASGAIWTTLAVNAVSAVVEYGLIARVFRAIPLLGQTASISRPINRDAVDEDFTDGSREPSLAERLPPRKLVETIFRPLNIYLHQAAFLPSLALSALYLTVLSFSGQMTTFLLAESEPKLTSGMVGILRMVATVFELSSTFAAPILMSKIGPVRAGIWFLSWQAISLTPAVACLWYSASDFPRASLGVFISAVILSRAGLWSFDLCAQLIIQESVSAQHRGLFSTVETSVQNFFELCAFAITIIFPKPEHFRYPAMVSLLAVYLSAALYAKFVRDRRGHLLHMPACLKPHQEPRNRNEYQLLGQNSIEHVHVENRGLG